MGRLLVTYQDYTDIYGGPVIPEAAWTRSYNDAEALASELTFGRIREALSEDLRGLAILAVCAAAEGLFRAEAGKSIASENNDGYSVAYRAPAEVQAQAAGAARSYLAGTGLLYRGVYE